MKSLISKIVSVVDIAPGRVMASMGMGFLSFAAITATVNQLISVFDSYWGGIAGTALQIASLAGFPVAFGITIGAIVTRVSLSSIPKLGKLS